MDASVVVDSGPIVVMLDADEANHDWVMSQVQRLRPPLVTCEAVLTEAAFLMSRAGVDSSVVPQLVTRGFVTGVKPWARMPHSRTASNSNLTKSGKPEGVSGVFLQA